MMPQSNIFGVITAALLVINTIIVWWSGRETREDVKEVHTVINSQLTAERSARNEQETKLVSATERAATAEAKAQGILEGIEQERARAEAAVQEKHITAALVALAEPEKK